MPNPAFEENHQGSARALVEHLRQNPAESRGDLAALADRFGLEPEFVRRALARLPAPERAETTRRPNRLATGAGGFVAWVDDALDRASEKPLRFEALSLVAAAVLAALLRFAASGAAFEWGLHTFRETVTLAVFLGVAVAQMAAFYRRRMVRYGLYGGLLFGVGTALPMMVWTWASLQRQSPSAATAEVTQGFVVFAVGLVMLLFGAVYAAVAAVVSLVGGWAEMRQADQEWERLSRQELLERYFELQRRLERSAPTPETPQRWEAWPPVAAVRRRPEIAATLLGFGTGLLSLVLHVAFGIGGRSGGNDAIDLLSALVTLVALGLFLGIAFVSGRSARGAAAGTVFALAAYAVEFAPLRGLGANRALASAQLALLAVEILVAALLGILAGMGATVQRRAARERQIEGNDGATLVAEMLEIQWRLEEDATSVTVLVVDAAKSTAMKVGADPLDVEYSFREYQTWIAECCAGFGGRVHSVAGDGAVVAFASGAAAMDAARRMQTDVVRFNAALNRLPKPFRLRLGLHAGQVAGDLNDVQFTEVIDIAAHVEEIAPVGGIAVTGAVVADLGEKGFLPLARDLDGQPVFIALVPTEA